MRWKKLGLVYSPDKSVKWASSHAMIPTPIAINRDVIRVYVTFCDVDGIGRPGYVDVSRQDPLKVLSVSQEPLLDLGDAGTFDENGLMPCSVIDLGGGRFYMYYVGFELGTKIRYRLLSGLAISDDYGESFRKYSKVPVLERSNNELYFRGGPYCINRDGTFHLWYVAGSNWIDVGGKQMPVYDIRYANSIDGIKWPSKGSIQISVSKADEHGFGRPCVIPRYGGGYRMFYSVRRISLGQYRLGYAESNDGMNWIRMDNDLNLDVTPNSFDSEGIMYAAPIDIDGRLFVFYNGNNFGRDGFAVATLESE